MGEGSKELVAYVDLFMFNVFCPAVLLNCLGGWGCGCLNLGL